MKKGLSVLRWMRVRSSFGGGMAAAAVEREAADHGVRRVERLAAVLPRTDRLADVALRGRMPPRDRERHRDRNGKDEKNAADLRVPFHRNLPVPK